MQLPRDVRLNVPQINPELLARFPRVHKKPYPRMMTHEVNGKHVPYKHGNGKPVIVNSADDEQRFLESKLGKAALEAETMTVKFDEPVKPDPQVSASDEVQGSSDEPRAKRKYTRRTLEP